MVKWSKVTAWLLAIALVITMTPGSFYIVSAEDDGPAVTDTVETEDT